ncbi:MAG: hypothetical protein RLZZ591_2715 [Pseudomonadota bacterium]
MQNHTAISFQPLRGVRILSLALNLPGPAALMRLQAMGATCIKLEPPSRDVSAPGASADPMAIYSPNAYTDLGAGLVVITADLKSEEGQDVLHRELAQAQIIITSFRPSALIKLGLGWEKLHAQYPELSHIAIVGSPGARADEAGHDLTYQAEQGLITGLDLPASLYADMTGGLMASEAVLQALLAQRQTGCGVFLEVALSEGAAWAAMPRTWGMTLPGTTLGGGHAGYRVYACLDGRVALAALEPHFAKRMALAAGLDEKDASVMENPATVTHLRTYFSQLTRAQLDQLAADKDIPLYTMAA